MLLDSTEIHLTQWTAAVCGRSNVERFLSITARLSNMDTDCYALWENLVILSYIVNKTDLYVYCVYHLSEPRGTEASQEPL